MDTDAQEFAPLGSDTAIFLEQIPGTEAGAVPAERLLSVGIPSDELDVLIGLLEPLHQPFTTMTAYVIIWVAAALIAAFVLLIFWKIWRGKIDITRLISEADGKASLSRVQALLFTVLMSGAILAVVVETGGLPRAIPVEILFLMGGSLGTYLASKGIQTIGGPRVVTADGSAATTADGAGPVLRYGAQAPVEVDANAQARARADHEIHVTATPDSLLSSALVAVAVGAVRLRVIAGIPADGLASATVRFIDENGTETSLSLMDEQQIVTEPNAISEVRVAFQPKGTARVSVSVLVQQLN